MKLAFKDTINVSPNEKTLVSMRDGVHEYLGVELNLTPPDKVFKVYRSSDEVKRVAPLLINLPLSDEHVNYAKLPETLEEGKILTSDIISAEDAAADATIAVKNKVLLKDEALDLIKAGKNELSLDYTGRLVKSKDFDFEQVDIEPKFLAMVSKGRCGEQCKFQDRKGEDSMDLKEILSKVSEMQDSDKKKLYDELALMFPKEDKKIEDEVSDEKKEELEDTKTEDQKEMKDSRETIEKQTIKDFKDSQCFKDCLLSFADERLAIITKAKDFLANDYAYAGKSNEEIMSDSLKAEKPELKFADSELSVAFKMLEKAQSSNGLQNFGDGDSKDCVWDNLIKGDK